MKGEKPQKDPNKPIARQQLLKKKEAQRSSNGIRDTRLAAEEGGLLAFYRGSKLGSTDDIQK